MAELRCLVESNEEFDLNAVIMMTLEAIYRGIRYDRVLFCLVTGDHDRIEARLGVGADVEPLIAKFQFPISLRSGLPGLGAGIFCRFDRKRGRCPVRPFHSPHNHRRGLFRHSALDRHDGIVAGCLYFDSGSEKFPVNAQQRQALNELKWSHAAAIMRKRRGVVRPAVFQRVPRDQSPTGISSLSCRVHTCSIAIQRFEEQPLTRQDTMMQKRNTLKEQPCVSAMGLGCMGMSFGLDPETSRR